MKKVIALSFLAILLITVSSCKKKNNTTKPPITDVVPFEYFEWAQIPAAAITLFDLVPAGTYLEAYSGSFKTNTNQELAAKGYTMDQIQKIVVTSLTAEITNNPGQTWDFLDTIKVFVDSVNGSTPKLFAYKYNFGLGLRTLNLDVTGEDVKDVFRADSVKMTFGGTKRAGTYPIQANTEIKISSKLDATVIVE